VTGRVRARLGVAAAALGLGCYRYAPATLETVPLGTEVRALVSTERELALRDSLGLSVHPLHGTLVEREAGRVLLAVRTAVGSPAFGSQPLYQHVGLTPQDVLRVDVRRLQRGKTTALALAVASAATLVTLGLLGKLNPGSPGAGGGGPPE
jgi:hypothetical protein